MHDTSLFPVCVLLMHDTSLFPVCVLLMCDTSLFPVRVLFMHDTSLLPTVALHGARNHEVVKGEVYDPLGPNYTVIPGVNEHVL